MEMRGSLPEKYPGLREWIVFLLASLTLLIGGACQPFLAFQRQTPTAASILSGISLYPTHAQAGDNVTVQGSGWIHEGQVNIYLMAPGSSDADAEAAAGVTADTDGRFTIDFVVPDDTDWQRSGSARVVARSPDGARVVQAILNLREPATPEASSTPTLEPTFTRTAIPSPAPSATKTPKSFFVTLTRTAPASTSSPPTRRAAMVTDVYVVDEQVTVSSAVDLNVRTGPGVAYPVVGVLLKGEQAVVTGANNDRTWLRIRFVAAPLGSGWVSRGYLIADDLSHVPVVAVPQLPPTSEPTATSTPPATAIATPTAVSGWLGEYFDNFTLSGSPVLVRTDPNLDFGWGDQGPGGGLPTEFFSVRWTQTMYFEEGTYYFTVISDDGVRFWVDGSLQLDEWRDTDPITYRPIVWLSEGNHTLKVEYYQHLANATIRLSWHRPGDWKARYYNNRKMKGDAVLDRYEDEVNHNWGTGSPDPVVAADNFSAVWTRQVTFEEDLYVFNVDVDDAVRLWVDGDLLIDNWMDGTRSLRAERKFSSKRKREVRVEYYEHYGNARVRLTWRRD